METIANRLKQALTARDMKQADIVSLTGIGKSSISTYLSGEYEPKQKNLYRLAKALNVNEAWLMGYDVPMERDPGFPSPSSLIDSIPNLMPLPKTREVPRLGTIACGEPILAQENIEDYFPIPVEMLPNKEIFMLKVKGDSMIEAGILNRDNVIVEKQATAENGDTVVALVDDSATVKTFYKENGHYRLQPQNSSMEPIIVDEVKILGKVIGVFRMIK